MRVLRTLVLTLFLATAAPAATDPLSLQERVDALAQQIAARYPTYSPRYAEQRRAVADVLAEWNSIGAAGSDANQDRIAAWLDDALRALMPGGSGVLPPKPAFAIAAPKGMRSSNERPTVAPQPLTPARPPEPILAHAKRSEPSPRSRERTPDPAPAPRRIERSVAKPAVATPTLAPSRSSWSQHPSAAPLEWRDPFSDDREASPNPLRSGERREVRRPAFRGAAVEIDLDQLSAQIRGYNAALRELQAEVMRLDEGDVFTLADAVDELRRLEAQRDFLDLYRSGLDATQRSRLPESPSADLVRELVRRRARTLSQQTPADRGAERRALQRLHDRLASN